MVTFVAKVKGVAPKIFLDLCPHTPSGGSLCSPDTQPQDLVVLCCAQKLLHSTLGFRCGEDLETSSLEFCHISMYLFEIASIYILKEVSNLELLVINRISNMI